MDIHDVENRKNLWLLLAVGFMALIINVDYTAVNLALVPMAFDLNAKISSIKWVLSGYVLAWGALVIPAGKTLDIYGPRRICLFGLVLFLVGSLVAGIATSENVLIVGRVIQGIAGAFYVPTLYGLICAYFPLEKRGFATGFFSLGVGLGMAIGPTFGGLILTCLNWRWIFLLNLPLGCFVMLIIFFTPEKKVINKQSVVDKSASFLLISTIVSIMYALDHLVDWGIFSGRFFALCLFAIAFFILFVWRQKYLASPLIPGSLVKNRNYTATTLALAFEQYSFAALVVIISLYLQKIKGMSVLHAGIFFLALTLAFAIVSPISGKLIDKFGVKPFALPGMLILALATLALVYLPLLAGSWIVLLILLVMGIGMGLAFSALNTSVVTTVSESEVGMASSVFLMLALFANTCGVIVSAIIYEWIGYKALVSYVNQQWSVAPLNNVQLQQLQHLILFIGNSNSSLDAFPSNVQILILKYLPTALAQGINRVLIVSALITFIGSCCLVFLNKKSVTIQNFESSYPKIQ